MLRWWSMPLSPVILTMRCPVQGRAHRQHPPRLVVILLPSLTSLLLSLFPNTHLHHSPAAAGFCGDNARGSDATDSNPTKMLWPEEDGQTSVIDIDCQCHHCHYRCRRDLSAPNQQRLWLCRQRCCHRRRCLHPCQLCHRCCCWCHFCCHCRCRCRCQEETSTRDSANKHSLELCALIVLLFLDGCSKWYVSVVFLTGQVLGNWIA